MSFIGVIDMLSNTVKIDKLCFGLDEVTPQIKDKVTKVIEQYYETFATSNNTHKKQLYYEVTPTKQRRESYNGYNHNLQMIPLEQFYRFLCDLVNVARSDFEIYEIHLAKDIVTQHEVANYLDTLKEHEYTNGYGVSTQEAASENTIYIAKKKGLDSNRKQKLRIKFYNKSSELISRHSANRVLPTKEPVETELPTDCVHGRNSILLYKLNLLRCELELRENNLPYTGISQMIEDINNGVFQDKVEQCYSSTLSTTAFAIPVKVTSKTSLKEIAITLARDSERDYKTLFTNSGLTREYNYFKKAKEVVTRENDLNFEELRTKLTTRGDS